MPISEKFTLDNSIEKMIGGVAAGISQVVKIDTAYIRVLLLILNILTFGVVGIVYLLILYIFRRREKADTNIEARSPHHYNRQKGDEATPVNDKTGFIFHLSMALLFIVLAAVRVSSEFRLFFFNEPFIQGLLFVLAGIAIAIYGASSSESRNGRSVSILAGSSIFFAGIYSLAVTIGRVGITSGENIEISEIIAATSIAYFGVVALSGAGRRLALLLSVVVGFCAASIGLHLAPISDLEAIGQFYDFFYPVIFGVLALWIAFDK
jgi:phage shock protein PspC (stress-responsive transcriptional regulator)